MEYHDLLSGLVRLHVLHHAAEHEIYGQWMIDELASHGYSLSPGTLYPMLHAMERKGYLTSRKVRDGRTWRKLYRATIRGIQGLEVARRHLRELTGETCRNR
ncbi:PadR family transcriptional regulator [Desulfonatronovibrio magnus]|uniref:PadR family transcriptional regulator n=1 Tax=Desulfonatronovibrio magnus TaxID=698827 RepID=UPI0005EB91F6|nr:PadR family transcriptional regulator [Desulfonatronovibrio magnus]